MTDIECGGEAAVRVLRWSPTGRFLSAASATGRVWLVDPADATILSTAEAGAPVHDVWFAADEERLLIWSGRGRLSWLPLVGGAVERWRTETGLSAVAVHPANGWLALGHGDGHVTLHTDIGSDSADTGRHHGPVTALAFAADRLVVGAGRPDHPGSVTVHTWTGAR